MPDLNRAARYQECPGCVGVDQDGRKCSPGNLKFCVSARAKAKGWRPGECVGCLLLDAGENCQSGNAKWCPVAYERNK